MRKRVTRTWNMENGRTNKLLMEEITFTYKERNVSQFVIEMLGLKVGDHTRLLVVTKSKDFDDKVMVAAHAFKHIRAVHFVKNFKFCYDRADDYCLCFSSGGSP